MSKSILNATQESRGLRDWLIDVFAPELRADEPAAPAAFREAVGVTVDADEENWRRISGDSQRDLSPMTQTRMQKMAVYLWESNLLANRLIELPVAYLLGEGVRIKVADPEAQAAVDRFWDDPINEMDLKLPKKVRELALYGEQCWPVFVNEHSRRVRLGYLDPSQIATVVKDPDNTEQPIGVVTVKDLRGRARRYRVIVNGAEDEVFTSRTRAHRDTFNDGDCFFFTINDLSNGARGRSDLLAQADWIDTYEQFMFGEADRALALRSFLWDVTLKGASPEEVAKKAKEIFAPKPGSVRVHNDSEEWSAEAPSLSSADTAESAKLFRSHILGGATVPPHWYADPGDVNRSTGESMSDPTVKMLTARQRVWMYILRYVARFVIRQAWIKKSRGEPDWAQKDLRIDVEFPEIMSRDTTKQAAALQQVVSSVIPAIDRGLMSEQLGLRFISAIAALLNVPFDVGDELEKARDEREARRDEDYFTPPPRGVDEDDTPAAPAA